MSMFKRKSASHRDLTAEHFSRRDEVAVSQLKEKGSLLQRTLSATALYQPERTSTLEQPDMVIGEGVSVSGEVCFEKTLRVDGEFKGELLSDGRLIVGPQGRVNCHINLSSAVIEGQVTGNITVTGSLELLGNAKIFGDISASSLVVAPGVTLIGQVCVKQDIRPLETDDGFALTNPQFAEHAPSV